MTLSEKANAGLLLVVFTALGLAIWQDRQTEPAIPDSTRITSESLKVTAPTFDSVTTNTLAGVDRQAATITSLQKAVGRANRQADAQRARAESLLALPRIEADSGPFWKQLHDVRLAENSALRQANDSLSTIVDTLASTRDSLRSLLTVTRQRLDATTGVNASLEASIVKLTTCRIDLGLIALPCLTRKQSAGGGLGLGLALLAAK